LIFALVSLATVVAYPVFVEKQFWKKTALAICALNLFPLVSGDYKLLHIFIPMFLFFF